MNPPIRSARLTLREFRREDAAEVYACISPQVTEFMAWDPPETLDAYLKQIDERFADPDDADLKLVVRVSATGECIGIAGIERIGRAEPELGIWLATAAQGRGYGEEAVGAVSRWAASTYGVAGFRYSVAISNSASRRVAEKLGGLVIGAGEGRKYDFLVYRIPAPVTI